MDMIEVDPTGDGSLLAAFDGRVLEVFGADVTGDAQRYHVGLFTVSVSGPNKKGHREVSIHGGGETVLMFLPLDDTALGKIQPLLDALKVAGVDVTD